MAGGGTAGHLFPCVAVAEQLRELAPDCDVRFVGAQGRIDEQILAERGLPHDLIPARPLPYRPSLEAVRGMVALTRSVVAARRIIAHFRPDAVFSTGGNVGAPVGIAARLARVPLVVHAADIQPDRGNRLLARWARAITTVSPEAAERLGGEAIVTGNPVRREVAQAAASEAVEALGLDPSRRTLLVTGGSQGARRLNRAVVGALPGLLENFGLQVVHLSGSLDYADICAALGGESNLPAAYHLIEHLPNTGLAMAAADLAVTRAGAGSLAELCLHAVPMIVVPYPFAGGHQRLNAEPLAEAGAAVIVEDEEFTAERLLELASDILGDPETLQAMSEAAREQAKPQAAREVARVVLQAADEVLAGRAERS